MIAIFKKSTVQKKPTSKATTEAPKTIAEVVEEIHETFYTEVDKLIIYANQFNSLKTDKQSLIEKCERLRALGFTKTKEIVEGEQELLRISELKKENDEKKDLIQAINYFSQKYPIYKFITEESVRKICVKYGLVYGSIEGYIGAVPDENLKQMEDFKISELDECHFIKEHRAYVNNKFKYVNKLECEEQKNLSYKEDYLKKMDSFKTFSKCPLEIAAPPTDFNTAGKEVENSKIIKAPIPDPIVLQPVIFKNKKHYLVVTAWGAEASDESVVNERMN